MRFQQALDSLPIVSVFVAFAFSALIALEGGYRVGSWLQGRTPDEKEGPTGMIVGSLLALLAFLLAITMGMASDRFDARRGLVLAEANAIGTMYLRAGYLPAPASREIRELTREYVPLRIATNNMADIQAKIARSHELQTKLWDIAEELARRAPESVAIATFIESLNEMIDLHTSRVTVGVYGRVPETVLVLLLLTSMLAMGMVGYSAGLTMKRSFPTAFGMILVLGAVITLVIDLDRPREGFLTVNQQPLVELAAQIGARLPANPRE
jgi:hypothetical protein